MHHNKYQETLNYEIYQLADPLEGQTYLIESVNPLPSSKPINLPYKQIKFKNSLLQIDYREILAIIDISNNLKPLPISSLCQPQINILFCEIHLIYHIIESSYYQNQLIQIYNNILDLNLTNLQFTTDASIQNLQTTNIQTSIGWICENGPSISFSAAVTPSPDSSRAELSAIISLLLVIPINSIITILTDSSIAIKSLLNFPTPKPIQVKN